MEYLIAIPVLFNFEQANHLLSMSSTGSYAISLKDEVMPRKIFGTVNAGGGAGKLARPHLDHTYLMATPTLFCCTL